MNWYKIYLKEELSNVPWNLFAQSIRWNLACTEFVLEYNHEPTDKTGVLTRDEAAEYTKTTDWDNGEPWASLYNGEG
jgi:hypothetical protein